MADEPTAERQDDEAMPEGEEAPPRGVRTMAIVRWVILGVAFLVAAFMWLSYGQQQLGSPRTGSATTAPKYLCPMHPQIVSNEPGECPICHMDLERMSEERGSGGAATDAGSGVHAMPQANDGGTTYVCPMHPEARSTTPGRCPICKMPLEPLANDAGSQWTAWTSRAGTQPGTIPSGTVPIQLALDRIQSIGVRTALASEKETSGALRVTAIVSPPEQGAAEVHVRTPGFVEAIVVDQTGVSVGAGQPLLSLYSPELLQAQNELLATRRWGTDGGLEGAARRKLDLLGMAPKEIDRVLEKGEPLKAISVVSPRAGYVTKKSVVLGSYVTPEMTLYEIQDLSRVYVVADVFLRDMPHVSVGTEARFVPAGDGSRSATAKVDLVYPLINAEARTRRVRMQIKSEAGKRHAPGEYGIVELSTGKRRALTVPRDALVDTGTAQYVFVVEKEGRFVPRTVTVGTSEGDHVIIDAGLQPGDRVVSGATFLIDSESRLQASVSQAAMPSMPPAAPGGAQGPSCDTDFDRDKMPARWTECIKCEKVHRGMGTMEADCKNAIAKPWK